MTVRELIEALQQLPPEHRVVVPFADTSSYVNAERTDVMRLQSGGAAVLRYAGSVPQYQPWYTEPAPYWPGVPEDMVVIR